MKAVELSFVCLVFYVYIFKPLLLTFFVLFFNVIIFVVEFLNYYFYVISLCLIQPGSCMPLLKVILWSQN